jgi:HSP20 family molecular chaperone IbpA
MPPVDVVTADGAMLLELALPGVDLDDITVERVAGALAISGIRRDNHTVEGNLVHAEIPRGPFSRTIPLQFPIDIEPRIKLDRGVLQIYLTLATATTAKDTTRNDHRTVNT